ncbi:MAG: Phosphonoacetaldehyde hydrolase [Verrucomicrobiota bacterium]|jgi:phosphonatase-like hydrolase
MQGGDCSKTVLIKKTTTRMSKIKMVMFDLSGTTVHDDTGVRDCLYRAAQEHGLPATPEEILFHMGTNKIHLYQYLIARSRGQQIDIRDFERVRDPETLEFATKVFDRYEEIMIDHYRHQVKEVPGAADTFRWCREHGIKVATDTGFHKQVTMAIMDGLGWLRDGLVDISVDVQDIPGERGRPAPFMIFHAMQSLDIQSVHEVLKIGDTPADMLEGVNAGCRGVVGVMSGPRPVTDWGCYRHTHVIPSVKELPALIESEFN